MANFLTEALVDQHVAVNGNADREHNSGNAGQLRVALRRDSRPKIIATLMQTAILATIPNGL